MPLHPYFVERLPALQRVRSGDLDDPGVRRLARDVLGDPGRWADPGVAVEEITIAGPHGPVPLRVYRPRGPVTAGLLWAHGGGFRAGDLGMAEAHVVSGELARRSGSCVVSVGYRLARGGVRYPVPVDDVCAAWSWLTTGDMLAEPQTVSLGGASAGAALALAAALRARDTGIRRPDALLLAYPFAHFPNPALDDESAAKIRTLPSFLRHPPDKVEDMVRNYVGGISDLPADALPGAARLHGLPPAHLVLAEYDELRASGELLERQLREVGVPVRSYLARGMLHGHLNWVADLPPIDESLEFFAGALRLTPQR